MSAVRPVVLVHGGLYEPVVDAASCWERPGVAPALRTLGYEVHTPARPARPRSWADESLHLADELDRLPGPAVVVAASNGCSAALRLAADRPALVDRLILCWPATGDDAEVDASVRRRLLAEGVEPAALDRLLDLEVQRGLRPDELRSITQPALLVPAEPEDAFHQRRTVAELRQLLPFATIGLGTPPSVHPSFPGHLGALVSLLHVLD